MIKTDKYDWTNFEDVKLESDRLLFDIIYTDPNSGWYCAKTAKFSGNPKDLEEPIGFNLVESSSAGPIRLSDAINEIGELLEDGCKIIGWEIKPCDDMGFKTNEDKTLQNYIIRNSKEKAWERAAERAEKKYGFNKKYAIKKILEGK